MRLILGLGLVLVLLQGCSLSKTAEIEIRAAALRYAFKAETAKWEFEGKKWTEIDQWVFVVDCDLYGAEVVKQLGDYPVIAEPSEVSGKRGFVEPSTGKFVAFWHVKEITRSKDGAYLADIGCVMGELHGYGQILRLEKVAGRWVVVSSTPTWVS